jgi:hypothetical protein
MRGKKEMSTTGKENKMEKEDNKVRIVHVHVYLPTTSAISEAKTPLQELNC